MIENHDAHVLAFEQDRLGDVFRRYPRTLQQAFKQSEGYRIAISGPYRISRNSFPRTIHDRRAPSATMIALQAALLEKPRQRWARLDRICWLIAVPLLILLAWAALAARLP